MPGQVFKPGERVPSTGLYSVTHAAHRPAHDAMLLAGERFPACAQCGASVEFRLLHAVHSIADDSDFKPGKARAHTRGRT